MTTRRYDKVRAGVRFKELQQGGFLPLDTLGDDAAVRQRILTRMNIADDDPEVVVDAKVGLALYGEFSPIGALPMCDAAADHHWRYLSLDVFPDVVYRRAGPNQVWFYGGRWRQWLKRVWWWVHLSWQGDEAATRAALLNMTTDTIAQIVERPGHGFRIDLTRRLAAEFVTRRVPQDQFRRLMRLNTALLVGTEPSCVEGGVAAYASQLYRTVSS